jgi:uncharacterized MAPEG superfamily protein
LTNLCVIPFLPSKDALVVVLDADLGEVSSTLPLTGDTPSFKKKLRIQRAYAASKNGLETLGYFAAAVVAANAAGVEVSTLNKLSLSYITSRIFYNVTYIQLQENRTLAPLRSMCWLAGLAISTQLFICAGRKFA